jgi:6-phosphogluconolactonase (cycloisomerase 2 family)
MSAPTPNGGGIYLFRIDPVTAALTQLQVIDDVKSQLAGAQPAQTRLYAVSEIDNYQESAAARWSLRDRQRLTAAEAFRRRSSGGTTPAHVRCIRPGNLHLSPTMEAAMWRFSR